MPWRPQPDRLKAHNRIRKFWQHFGFHVIEADSDPWQPFSIAVARNNAVRRATTDTVIVADADSLPDIASVLAAVEDSRGGVTYPYETFKHIDGGWSDKADLLAAPVDQTYNRSVGGMFITRRETYWRVGGMDEMFHPVWGYEDNAFALAAQTLVGIHRQPGNLLSFNHSANRDLSQGNPNKARYALYLLANNKPDVMAELVRR